jgi:hypothetical protein
MAVRVRYPPPVDDVLGGRYRLQERLGQGGTGEVYRAFDERLERPVAVKIMHAWVADDREARERFRREATLMARLRHRNIVAIHDYDNGVERPYLVQEHCPGGTIGLMVEAAPLPWDRVRSIAVPILSALEHAHAAGVIHRDLKPTNVLYAADGTLAVGDFGLARAIAGQTLTADGAIVGTPEYWSPEQAANQPVTEKTDIYALGCILYQLATGSLPFTGEDRLAVGWARTHEQPVPAIERNPLLPDEADELIRSLMEVDPAKRPRAGEVLARLEGRLATAPRGEETIAIADEPTFVASGGHDDPRTERIAGVEETLAVPAPPSAQPVLEAEPEPLADEEPPAPPRREAPPATPLEPAYPGVSLATPIVALLFGAAAAAVGIVAERRSALVAIGRTGLAIHGGPPRDDARAALVILACAVLVCLATLTVATWAARGSGRAHRGVTRVLLGVFAVLCAAVTSAAVVWSTHAIAVAHVVSLWRHAR